MGWFGLETFFNKKVEKNESEIPIPPSLNPIIPPPERPKYLTNTTSTFTGFSPPPLINNKTGDSDDLYSSDDYSKYVSPVKESNGLYDDYYSKDDSSSLSVPPRLRNCIENIKLGSKMGAAVGGIFGGLTGIYASYVHRNILLLPISMAGGALSFGFFLGCGMLVRCQEFDQ